MTWTQKYKSVSSCYSNSHASLFHTWHDLNLKQTCDWSEIQCSLWPFQGLRLPIIFNANNSANSYWQFPSAQQNTFELLSLFSHIQESWMIEMIKRVSKYFTITFPFYQLVDKSTNHFSSKTVVGIMLVSFGVFVFFLDIYSTWKSQGFISWWCVWKCF